MHFKITKFFYQSVFYGISWSGYLFTLEYLPEIEQSRINYFKALIFLR